MSTGRPRAVMMMSPASLGDRLFDGPTRARLERLVDLAPGVITQTDSAAALQDAELALTGWGSPQLDDETLRRAPLLRAVIHAGGSAAHLLGATAIQRGLLLSNAGDANAESVAEYTVAMILLAGKSVLTAASMYRAGRRFIDRELEFPTAGNYRRVVGLIGASRTGRKVIQRLQTYDVQVLLHDPTVSADAARDLGATPVTLDELMSTSTVVSVHAPVLPQTRGMIDARTLSLLPDGATLINTARGVLVDQEALVTQLQSGRINAILDVTEPDVLPPEHPLYDLPNVLLTPHVAGAMGNELSRLGRQVVDEVERYVAGQPFAFNERLGLLPPADTGPPTAQVQ